MINYFPVGISDLNEYKMSETVYYILLALVFLPVKLFFTLWYWLGWELFKNN